MAAGFLNREDKQIPKSEWQELRADESYKQVRRYDNGVDRPRSRLWHRFPGLLQSVQAVGGQLHRGRQVSWFLTQSSRTSSFIRKLPRSRSTRSF